MSAEWANCFQEHTYGGATILDMNPENHMTSFRGRMTTSSITSRTKKPLLLGAYTLGTWFVSFSVTWTVIIP